MLARDAASRLPDGVGPGLDDPGTYSRVSGLSSINTDPYPLNSTSELGALDDSTMKMPLCEV